MAASPSDVLVSTSSSKSGLIASGPVGTSATTSSSVAVASSVQASAASLGASRRSRSLPGPSSRRRRARPRSPTRPPPGTRSPGRAATEQTATASRGMALRLLPPSSETSRNGTARVRLAQRPAEHLDRVRVSEGDLHAGVAAEPPLTGRERQRDRVRRHAARGASTLIQVSVLPAHPTVRVPSSSLSRLIRIAPVSSDPSSAFAPSSPTSSATVISSSSGPCGSDSSSTSAIIAAIATPSSAPSVVPSAVSHSPSRMSSIRPSAGSFGLEGSRSQTMSRWPWSMRVGAFSRPALAGTRITRFRPASCSSSNPCRSAHSRTCSIAGSS